MIEEQKTTTDKIGDVASATIETLKYEANSHFEFIRTGKFWLVILAALGLLGVLINKLILTVISLIILLVILFKKDYDSGKVKGFIREKSGIPSRGDIKKMKEQNSQ